MTKIPNQRSTPMSDRSHVSLEQHRCLICGTTFETGTLLLDKRLRPSMERLTLTGWGLCPEHQQLFDDDFIAFVEITNTEDTSPSFESADRTGRVMHIRRPAAEELFGQPFSKPFAFIALGVIEHIQQNVLA